MIIFDLFLGSEQNHFSKSGEATFLAHSSLVYFKESFFKIRQQSLLLILRPNFRTFDITPDST
jgi:hypothetical protein